MKKEYFLIKGDEETINKIVEYVKPFFLNGVNEMASYTNKEDLIDWLEEE